MGHLSLEAKENIVRKALNREHTTLEEIAKDNNIGYSTLQRWLKEFSLGALKGPSRASKSLNNSEKLEHIVATASLNDVSLGKYCRKHGLYSHQLQEWRANMIKPNNKDDKDNVTKLQQKIASLEKELKRKDKALAEASALLIMKKKQT